jgi:hypothetical protein
VKSACFGLFAAGYRKYVDPASDRTRKDPTQKYGDPSDPTRIGVHSIYELIRQEGAQTVLWKEAGDATIQAVRLLNTLGIPDSVIAKIVTTPPKEMSYLTIKELWEMGVEVAGHPKPPKEDNDIDWGRAFRPLGKDLIFLSPAVVRSRITLNDGSTIPAGTVVVARDDVTWDAFIAADKTRSLRSLSLCFGSAETDHLCTVSYHPANGPVATAQLREASLELIRQGFQDWFSAPPSSPPSPAATPPEVPTPPQTHPAPPQLPQQSPQTTQGPKRPFHVVDASEGFLSIRNGPGTTYQEVTKMPLGATGLVGRCVRLESGWKPFCEVEWSGWASSCCMAELGETTQFSYRVTQNLILRSSPDKSSWNMLTNYAPNDYIPEGKKFTWKSRPDATNCAGGSGGEVWCRVTYPHDGGIRTDGWVSAHFMRSTITRMLLACLFQNPNPDCADDAAR